MMTTTTTKKNNNKRKTIYGFTKSFNRANENTVEMRAEK